MLLINNSSDASVQVARRAAALAPRIDVRVVERNFHREHAHAGSARRAAMEAGADWLEQTHSHSGILLTTDADAVPAPDWVARSRAALQAGADVAAAALVCDSREEAYFTPPLRNSVAQVVAAQTLAVELEDLVDLVPGDPHLFIGTIQAAGLLCGFYLPDSGWLSCSTVSGRHRAR